MINGYNSETDILYAVKDILNKIAKYKAVIGEEYSSRAYAKAAELLTSREVLFRIVNGESVPKGIGKKIREAIIQFIANGIVLDLEELKLSPKIQALERFEQIIGVGPINALKFVSMGYTSIEELSEYKGLTEMQKIGIKYYDKIMPRIPREIITTVFNNIKVYILSADESAEPIIVGSYRRGKLSSGDVDILVKTDVLKDTNLIVIPDAINLTSGPKKRSLLYPHNDLMVQVDIFLCPSSEYIACLNYATGSARHNIILRTAAQKRGYKLSQNGLFKVSKESGQVLIPLESEKQLYELLGMSYIEPADRE